MAQRVGDQRTQVYTLELLGTFQLQLGTYLAEPYEASHRQCLSLCQKMQFESMINSSTLSGLGVTLIWNGKFAEGCSYLLKRSHKVFDKGPDKTAFLYNGLSMAYLHQGQYDQAYSHCELSLSAAYRSTIPRYISTTLWTKGLIALVQDDPITAEQSLHESLSVIKDIDLVGCHEFPLVGLAFLASQAGDLSAMRHDLWRALRIAVATQSFLSLLHIFPAVALYLSGQRQQAAFALEIYALISQYGHVANSRWFAEIVGDHLQATQASLPAALIAKALRRGKHRDMWSTARGLLAMLANE
ncbi:MAG: tetratricopeptide repeat protein [Caldilineaceae bacterium]|nr:tetratricopeptide repeat protein [Caldilineaceae bacterium]